MIEIYVVRMEGRLTDEQYGILYENLSETKKKKIQQYYFWEDAQRTLLGDAMIRKFVGEKLKVDCRELEFAINKYGKPYINGNTGINFNISHSGEIIVCSIGERENGIDVEKIKKFDIKIVESFFQHEEFKALFNLPKDKQNESFFRLWTLKESYIKCVGKGLAMPLNSFGFKINNYSVEFCGPNKNKFKFEQFRTKDDYYISVCTMNEKVNKFINYINIDDLIV